MSFNQLGLSEALLKAITKKGYSDPSPIQEKAIPVILDRKDILSLRPNGYRKNSRIYPSYP